MERTLKQSISCFFCNGTSWIKGENGAYRRCDCYDEERLRVLWKSFGVAQEDAKKLSDYIPCDTLTKKIKDGAIGYIKNFESLKNLRGNSFGLLGQSGGGKSHISIAIGVALLQKKHKVIYMPYLEGMRNLKANTLDDECYLKLISRYQEADILIIDDLFKDKVKGGKLVGELSEADMRHIYPILNYRYNNKLPTIFSTECNVNQLLDLDEALGGRIIESCGENLFYLKGSKYNYRLKNIINSK